MIFSLMPAMLQLRTLRSLPVSATTLTSLLLAIVILPLAGFYVAMAIADWLLLVPGAVAAAANSFLLSLPFMMFNLLFIAWFGPGTASYVVMVLLMIAAQVATAVMALTNYFQGFSLGFEGVVSGLFLVISFWVIRQMLVRSGRPYRVHAGTPGLAWGGR
jgi:hypothetical protein